MIEYILLPLFLIASICLLAFLQRPIEALLSLTFVNLLWPNYIVYKFGVLPGITPPRAVMLLLIISLFILFCCNKKYRIKLTNITLQFKTIFVVLFSYTIVNILSAILHSDHLLGAFFSIINDFLNGPMLLILILVLLDNKQKQQKLYTILLLAFFTINLIGLIEWINRGPLFTSYLLTETKYTLITAKVRGDSYRLMSVFANSLIFSQLLVLSIPLCLYAFLYSKRLMKILLLINLALTIFLLIKTGSRAGLGLLVTFPFLYLYSRVYHRSSTKIIRIILIFFPLLALFAGSIYITNNLDNFIQGSTIGSTADSAKSTLARVKQIKLGVNALKEHPFLGYGPGEGVKIMYPRTSIDNLYLTIVLDTGLIGLFLFFVLNYLVFKYTLQKKYIDYREIFICLSIVLILLFFLILSIDTMMTIYYILVAMLLQSVHDKKKSQVKQYEKKRTNSNNNHIKLQWSS